MARSLIGVFALCFALLFLGGIASPVLAAAPPASETAPKSQTPKAQAPKTAQPKAAPEKTAPAAKAGASEPAAGGEGKATEPASGETAPAGTEKPAASKEGVDSSRRKSEIYGERLDSLQAEVDDLKDRIFRSKARLSVLKETVLKGVLAGSRVQVAHRNRMGSQFKLVKIVMILDGAQIFAKSDESGALNAEDEIVIYDANLPPGPHNLTIELRYRGQGFGVFSYLNGYTFDSRSSHSFTAPENGSIKVLSVGYEKGNFTTEMDDRPAVNWQQVGLDASGRPLPRQRGKGGAPKGAAARTGG